MPTILIKKSDTPGAAPTGSDLTNLAGGAEIAVNTADKRVFSMNSSSAIIELGTNPGSLTTADASATVLRSGSATITDLIATSASITTLTATSASVTNLTATSLVLSNLSIASANVTTLTSSSATITNLLATSLTVSSGSTLNGGVVVNESGADVDFRIESDTNTHMLFVDAGNSRVGINESSPDAPLHITASTSATIVEALRIENTASGGQEGNSIVFNPMFDGKATIAAQRHAGNANATEMFFTTDTTGATTIEHLRFFTGTATVFNETGADVDFRIESDTDANAFFLDAGNSRVGINNASPATALDVAGTITADGLTVDGVVDVNGGQIDLDTGYPIRWGGAASAIYAGSGSADMVFTVGSAERFRVNGASGNFGIGTSTPQARLHVLDALSGGQLIVASSETNSATKFGTFATQHYTNSEEPVLGLSVESNNADNFVSLGGALGEFNAATVLRFYTAANNTTVTGTERARIDSSGNFGIGTSSPNRLLDIATTTAAGSTLVSLTSATDGNCQLLFGDTASDTQGKVFYDNVTDYMSLHTNGAERARITSGGSLLVGTTTFPSGVSAGQVFKSTAADWSVTVWNSNATPYGARIQHDTDSNGTGNEFLLCLGAATTRATIRSNGGLANYQSNNVDLSDERTKKDITLAPSYWDKIGALEIVTYKYNDQTHDDVNVGVIAQQVEAVEPVWVDSDGFGETPEGEEPLKTVYTKDITFAAIKALQEAMTRIEELEAKVAALEAK